VTTCLIVDDSSTIRKITRKIIEDFGFSCEEAEDGLKAKDACGRIMPDVIILDWNMPNMNGIEFLKALREMENGQHPLVLFCTTESGMDFIQSGMEAGANEYIMKPFDKSIVEMKFVQLGLLEEKNA
jgi:two-component system chemotaxis response regulator CheY